MCPFLTDPLVNRGLEQALAGSFDIAQTALTRHPLELWLSTKQLQVLAGRLTPADFLAAYLRYAKHASATGFIRFEDFTSSPEREMKQLCKSLKLDYDPEFINRWSENRHVTGDVSGLSRGSGLGSITPLERRHADEGLLDVFRNNPDYRESLDLLAYRD